MKQTTYTIDSNFPNFNLVGSTNDQSNQFNTYSLSDFNDKWLVIFFYPYDFTFVCPTEIEEFGRLTDEFAKYNCEILGCSTDSEYVHNAWRQQDKRIKDIPYPLLSDKDQQLSRQLGILTDKGYSRRATYILNQEGKINHLSINADSVGRKPLETLRILKALQHGDLCMVNWEE